jgi:hypothetical protein
VEWWGNYCFFTQLIEIERKAQFWQQFDPLHPNSGSPDRSEWGIATATLAHAPVPADAIAATGGTGGTGGTHTVGTVGTVSPATAANANATANATSNATTNATQGYMINI